MAYVYDAETEALRAELMQLPHKELIALAHQEGVSTKGRAQPDIVEALLRMDCEDDAAATSPKHAPGQLAPHRDQPSHSRHAGQHSSSAYKQQHHEHLQHGHAQYTSHQILAAQAYSKHQQQQYGSHRPGAHHQTSAAAGAAGTQTTVDGLQSRQQHYQAQQQELQRAQEQHVRRQQLQQQRHNRHSEQEQELHHESSFTFVASSASAGGMAGSNSSTAPYAAVRGAHGDDSRGMPYKDQVYSVVVEHSAEAHAPAATAAAAHGGGSGSSGRISARRESMTPTNSSREAYKQQQNLLLETKMQQLEQSLQQLQRSPRLTPQHSSVSAQQSYISNTGQSSGGGSAVSGSGGGSAAKTNRRLWSSPSVSGQSQPSPAPAAAGGAAPVPGSPYLQPPLSPSSRRPSSRSGSQGIGRSPEPFASASHGDSNGSRSSSRPRPSSALVSAPTAGSGAVGGRPGSSGGGAYGSRGSSNILAEFAAQRPAATAGAVDRQHVPSPNPSPQPSSAQKEQHARSLSMSPAPAKGTPRVGVMPCQKALLKKAAQEAAKAAAAAAAAPGSVTKQASAERLGSSKGSGSGGGSRDSSAVSSSGALSRGAASSSGVVTRSSSSARPGTPETPSRARQAAAAMSGAPTPTAAAAQRAGSSKDSIIRPLSPGIWPPAGAVPPPSPKMSHPPSGRAASSVSGSQVGSQTAAGRLLSSSATGRVSASVNGVLSGASASDQRRQVKAGATSSLHTDPAGSWSEAGAGTGSVLDRERIRGESISGAARTSRSRASVSGSIRAGRTPRAGGAATPPPGSHAGRTAARGSAVSHSGALGYSSSSNGTLPQREQAVSVTGAGLAKRARQMLAGSPVLGRHAREASAAAEGAGRLPSRQQQESAAAARQHQLLHTPLRVKPPAAGAAASSRAGALQAAAQQQGAGGAGYSTPVASKTRSMAAAAAAAVSAAVTPARQQVRAFGDALSAAYGDTATTPAAAGRTKTAPLAGTAAAAAAAAASDGPAVMIGGLMTPKAAAMGSARRVASTQARTAVAAAAAAAQDTAALTDRGLAGVPVTPLHKGARRTVPSESGAGDEVDKHLQALVERCLRIRSPDAHKLALQGPEPAKTWLQQHVIGPWKRAGANSSSSGSNGGPCMAAGYCCRSLLLHGPSGSGKTELVYALATEMGANLLYVPGGENLLKTYQQEGHRLLRAMFAVARRVAPCVVCFDDAHMTFPSSMSRMSDPGGAAAIARMIVELEVQLQQLLDMQSSLESAAAQPQAPQSAQKASGAGRTTPRRITKSSSGGGSSGDGSAMKPVWGFFGCKAKSKSKEQSPEEGTRQKKPQQGGYAKMAGPVVVVFVTHRPEALDGALLQQLPVQLQLDLPATEAREDLLMGWLMEREAAVNVQDVDWLAQQTEGFSCSDLVQLCNQAARRPAQERSQRAICMSDLEVALDSMLSARQQQQQPKQQQQYLQAQQLQQYQQQQQQYQAQHYAGGITPVRGQHAGR